MSPRALPQTTLFFALVVGASPGVTTVKLAPGTAIDIAGAELESLPSADRNIADYLRQTPGVQTEQPVSPSAQKVDQIIDPLINPATRVQLNDFKRDLNAANGKDAKLAVIAETRRDLAEASATVGEFVDQSFNASAEAALNDLEAYFKSDKYDPSKDQAPGTAEVIIRGSSSAVEPVLSYTGTFTDPTFGLTLRGPQAVAGLTAEYGRYSGGVINVITKSGSNNFSGLSFNLKYDDWQPDATVGDGDYSAQTQEGRWAGTTLGGPIIKDKLWFWASYGTNVDLDRSLFIGNTTEEGRFQVESNGQSTTVNPNTSTLFNPTPGSFTGFSGTAYQGQIIDTKVLDSTNDKLFYPNTTLGSYGTGFGGTVVINQDFVNRVADRMGSRNSGATGGSRYTGVQILSEFAQNYFTDHPVYGDHSIKFGFDSGTTGFENGNGMTLFGSDGWSTGGGATYTPTISHDALIRMAMGIDTVPAPNREAQGVDLRQLNPRNYSAPSIESGSSLYVNDRWQLNDKWSFNIGLRYEDVSDVDATNETGSYNAIDVEKISPRLGIAYDVRGDGKLQFNSSYSEYAGRYSELSQPTTGGRNWDGTFGFDAGGRGVVVPSCGSNFRAHSGISDLRFNPNDQFIFNRGPITTSGYFGYGDQGFGFFNNTVEVKFEYSAPCSELLTEADIAGILGEYSAYLYSDFASEYPMGGGMCGGRVGFKTYAQQFAYLMQNDSKFRDFFNFRNVGRMPPQFRLDLSLIEPRITLDPTAPSRDAGPLPNDAFLQSSGSVEKKIDDQWGLKRIGFEPGKVGGDGVLWPRTAAPTIVAVVDSGIDLTHPELQGKLWANFNEVPNNGKDDDGNGLVDDVLGWNFDAFNNDVFDMYGHGTFIAGIIGAVTNNGAGIAGINPWARIMPVKVSTYHGRSSNFAVAQGIYYAVEMGARVINVSFEGDVVSKVIQAAVDHAVDKGVLVVVAAGNRGVDVAGVSPAAMRGALTVASIGPDGDHEGYSNFGQAVDIAAPGTHIISLRAARTDLMQFEDPDYKPGSNILGEADTLYHLSGTSFAAPHVAGVASLLFSINPDLTAEQVKRMILQSARDIGTPGTDRLTGYGELDAAAALAADPEFYVDAVIDGVEVVGSSLRINGTAAADKLKSAWIELGEGENPDDFERVGSKLKKPVIGDAITDVDVNELRGSTIWTLQLVVEHKDGTRRVNRYQLNLG